MQCDFCLAESGLLLMTNQETGDTQSIGTECMPTFLKAMSQTWGAWPNLDDVLTAEVVEAKAKELGIWPELAPLTDATVTSRPLGAKAPRKRSTAAREAVTAAQRVEAETRYADVPATLLTAQERATQAQALGIAGGDTGSVG